MDRKQFDTLARLVSSHQSRRRAIAAILGAALLGQDATEAIAKGKASSQAKAKVKICYPGTRCTPGKGKNTSGCDFAFSTLFRNLDARGANLSTSSFRGADLRGADFRGANLSGACLAGASLHQATLGASVNLGGAIFCNTVMPDGSVDDSGCGKTTACCPHIVQDCPDAQVNCWLPAPVSEACTTLVGSLGPVGHCYKFPTCCPCDHRDADYWVEQCNQTFPACGGQCVAEDAGGLIECFSGCPGGPL